MEKSRNPFSASDPERDANRKMVSSAPALAASRQERGGRISDRFSPSSPKSPVSSVPSSVSNHSIPSRTHQVDQSKDKRMGSMPQIEKRGESIKTKEDERHWWNMKRK
jgi:hypothetical protein